MQDIISTDTDTNTIRQNFVTQSYLDYGILHSLDNEHSEFDTSF